MNAPNLQVSMTIFILIIAELCAYITETIKMRSFDKTQFVHCIEGSVIPPALTS